MFNRAKHRVLYEHWLSTLSPEEQALTAARVQSAEERFNVEHDIRWQYDGLQQRRMPCGACGVLVAHAFAGSRWYACEDHAAPCGRICLFSSEASHFGGQILRAFADSPDCHQGRHCECQRLTVYRPLMRIPVHASLRR